MGVAATAVSYVAVSRPWEWSTIPGKVIPVFVTPPSESFAVPLLATVWFLNEARVAVDSELERTEHEQIAFERFARQLRRIDTDWTAPSARTSAGSTVVRRPPGPDSGDWMAEIRTAYRETVMATPHYRTEFGESMLENMAREFSADVAMAVASGSAPPDRLVAELGRQARGVVASRRAHADRMDRERAMLDDAEQRLSEVLDDIETVADDVRSSRDAGTLVAGWNRLDRLRGECDALLAERQRLLQRDDAGGRDGCHVVPSYLYRDLPVTFPVLHAGATVADRVEAVRGDLIGAMTTLP